MKTINNPTPSQTVIVNSNIYKIVVPKFDGRMRRTGKNSVLTEGQLVHLQSFADENYDNDMTEKYNTINIGYYAFGDTIIDLIAN